MTIDDRFSRHSLIACAQALVFALYPILLVLRGSMGLPLGDQRIAQSVGIALGAISLLLWGLGAIKWSLTGRAMWSGFVLALFTFYLPAVTAARGFGSGIYVGHWGFSLVYALVCITIASVIIRPWRTTKRDPIPLSLAALAMLAVSGWPIVTTLQTNNTARGIDEAKRMAERTTGRPGEAPGAARDIYYLVLDAFGRSDVLGEQYGEPLDELKTYLKSRGFYVADQARSNYGQTFLSLSSTLNMTYLDELAAAMGSGSGNRLPLQHLIQRNALMKLAKKNGYRIVAVGSDVMATARLEEADVCYCDLFGLREFEQAVAALTPMSAFALGRWTYHAHYRKVLYSFAAIEQAQALPGPKLVFAHILSPHPPFVLASDGQFAPTVTGPVMFNDGDLFPGSPSEYRTGYRHQVQYVATRLQAIVEQLVNRSGPSPVIVIHGDHGPGAGLNRESPQGTDLRERMSIFAAYRFPDAESSLYPTITSVNAARILAARYLGADLSLLPDRSYFSTWSHPYEFFPVSATGESRLRERSER